MRRRWTVETRDAGARADVFLARRLGISRHAAQALLQEGRARAGGRVLRKGAALAAGEEVVVDAPEAEWLPADPIDRVSILYVDPAIVVVDKPAGMPTHPLRPGERGTAANALCGRFPELRQVGAPREGGAVHRLDAGTSGLLCFARTEASYRALRAAFHEGRVEKTYIALCLGDPPGEGRCVAPIGHPRKGSPRARAYDDPARAVGALPAETRFRVTARYRGCALLEVEAHTGRMHQVRVHLAHLGFPLAGDELYRAGGEPHDPTSLDHPFLHAARLVLPHPDTGRPVRFEAPLPEELRRVLASLGPP